jgi:enoyl-[acyl-carrier protein] reductase/trans-2-enoyl-CoA reductase (NAD+)
LGNAFRCSRKIAELWQAATTENLADLGDLEGYRSDFHNLFGFGFDELDRRRREMVGVNSIA